MGQHELPLLPTKKHKPTPSSSTSRAYTSIQVTDVPDGPDVPEEPVKKLEDPGDLNDNGDTNLAAIHLVVSGTNEEVLKNVIDEMKKQNIDINLLPLHDNISVYFLKLHGDKQDPGKLLEHVKLLIENCKKGVDLNDVAILIKKIEGINNTTLIEMAADRGYTEIFQILLDCNEEYEITVETLKNLLENFQNENHKECFQMLMNKLAAKKDILDINKLDDQKKSPLYYAIKYGDSKAILDILKLGAYLGQVYDENKIHIDILGAELLKKHLDSCITSDKEKEKYTFDFVTLIPPQNHLPFINERVKDSEIFAECETNVISHMSNSPDLKHLLKHPVIDGFLLTKWHRLKILFWVNALFYYFFYQILLGYVLWNYTQIDNDRISTLGKWFAGSLYLFLGITFIMLVFMRLFLIIVSPKTYCIKLENLIDLCLIVITFVILIFRSISSATRNQLSAVAIILANVRLFLVIGQHPHYSVNAEMLKTVCVIFFKSLLGYSILIEAFALSFTILYRQSSLENAGNATDKIFIPESGEFKLKTILMMAGHAPIDDNNLETMPIINIIITLLAIFMISIILVNLLNGIVASHISKIMKDVELYRNVFKTQYIIFIEFIIIRSTSKRILGTLMSWITYHFICHLHTDDSRSKITVNINDGEINGGNKSYYNTCLDEASLKAAYNITLPPNTKDKFSIPNIHEKLDKLITLNNDL